MVIRTSFIAYSKKILIEARPLVTTYVLLYRESIKNKKAVIKKRKKKKEKTREDQRLTEQGVRVCSNA